jgi:hypothetical protein
MMKRALGAVQTMLTVPTVPAVLFALAVALLVAGCSDPTPPPAPSPVDATITDTFSGTLNVSGNNVHQFPVSQVGSLKVTLTSLDPPASVGIGVGTPSPSSGTCTILSNMNVVAGPSVQISGTATVTGNFCVSIYDAGNLVEPVNYTVVILHS